MKCPACGNMLEEMTAGDATVDVCKRGCGGIWFDHLEIKKFDEPHESAGECLLDIERDNNIKVDYEKRLKCPKCDDTVMMRHYFSIKRKVIVDECPGCGGFWLDAGELRDIRSLFSSEEERNKATEQYYSEIFGEHFAITKSKSEAELCKAKKIKNMFGFIRPSNYIS